MYTKTCCSFVVLENTKKGYGATLFLRNFHKLLFIHCIHYTVLVIHAHSIKFMPAINKISCVYSE
jgi:hypothetical protein